ncbi:LPXTG cell wall anchor domain-containing protein [Micromonospora sp. MH99]|uniref:LPXTG cell wall anchor domain-containing protein n=1 Tax=Micromonospora sp. MH99 TaxID=1945510 RepID=UPI001F470B3A|nr:LPXTG cell wall anchor domain-containing protein [Micromonospora sp. MH99]MCF0095944.1 hypothetical protein [Micromonospora sp. MH99]
MWYGHHRPCTATTPPPAGPTATATPSAPSTSIPDAAQLPRTGSSGSTYALIGVALLALGAGLLVLRRRMSRA